MKSVVLASCFVLILSETCVADEKAPLANCKLNQNDDYYSPKAIRLDQSGTVLLEYSVKAAGGPTNVVIIRATAPGPLKDSALHAIKSMRCSPDPHWLEAGGAEKRLRTNVIFKLKGVDETAEPLDPAADVITIAAESIGPPKRAVKP